MKQMREKWLLSDAELAAIAGGDVNGQGGSDVIIGSVGLNGLISLDLDGGEGNDLLIGSDGADVLRKKQRRVSG